MTWPNKRPDEPDYYRVTYLRANGERVARDFVTKKAAFNILRFLLKWARDTRPTLAPVYRERPTPETADLSFEVLVLGLYQDAAS